MNLSTKVPLVPQRRDGDIRLAREIDDMFVLFSCLDEHNLLDDLPRYVASGPDSMPSVRMYEGDFSLFLNMMKKMSNEISEMRTKLAVIVRDVRAISYKRGHLNRSLPYLSYCYQQSQQSSAATTAQPCCARSVDNETCRGDFCWGFWRRRLESIFDDNRSGTAGPS